MAQLARLVRATALAPALVASVADPVSGAPVSFTAAVSKTGYGSGEYGETDGDWRAEAVLRYESRGLFRAGIGAEVGKLDEPYSDPSFTAVGVFGELGLGKVLANRWSGLLAGRYGWSHERVGEESNGLWAWGWQAGVLAGVDYGWRIAPRSDCRPKPLTSRSSATRASRSLPPVCAGKAGASGSG
jgi:hypothetical protein